MEIIVFVSNLLQLLDQRRKHSIEIDEFHRTVTLLVADRYRYNEDSFVSHAGFLLYHYVSRHRNHRCSLGRLMTTSPIF